MNSEETATDPVKRKESPNGIVFYRVTAPSSLHDFLTDQNFEPGQINFFLHRGCVYVEGVRTRSDVNLQTNQVVRLHTRPKKYSWASGVLIDRIVYDCADFLVLDKPAGLPVHATLDNFVDNAKYILEQELGVQLYSTHRLDIPTSGLLILAKHPRAQALINKLFAERRVEKIYRAMTAAPVASGEHVLYLDPAGKVPRAFSFESRKGWWECRLRVLDSAAMDGGEYFHTIQLLTGKTHQIRAQLSALGAPVIGDEIYGGGVGELRLKCHSLSFAWRGNAIKVEKKTSQSGRSGTKAHNHSPNS